MKNLVSVIMNCYNGEEYLENSLKSVIMQKYNNWELIFWDNQSTDNSKKIFDSFSNKNFKYYLSEKHTSLYEARNLACEKANGEYIAFIDCDDEWHNDFLSQREIFFENKFYDYSYSNSCLFFEKSNKKILHANKKLLNGLIYDFLAKDYLVTISSLVIKKKLLEEIGSFNPDYNIIGDFDFVMRISKTKQALAIQNPLLLIRIHGNNFHDKNRKMFFNEFKNWYFDQIKDSFFTRNKKFFFKKLARLFVVSLFPTFIKDFFKKK
ncbi:glycosyltransferase [Pelagibacterales bacterium SAG-MED46]|nr:glycosyltransferase [Pelagibacterales bacterium SAG-MED46]